MPAGQFAAHELAPIEEDVPLEQAVQPVFPVPVEYVPTGHDRHDTLPEPLANVPAGQGEHVDTNPRGVIGLVRNCPAGH